MSHGSNTYYTAVTALVMGQTALRYYVYLLYIVYIKYIYI